MQAYRRPFLFFLAFLAGAGVMTLEMAGARALSPYFGSSNYVWANVIGALMASLALGYYIGGRVADRTPRLSLLLILLGSAGVGAGVASPLLAPVAALCVPQGIIAEHSFRINLFGSLLATLIFLVPPVFVLGMVPPFLVRLLARSREESGSAAGAVNAFGAVGSIAGTFFPTLVLIPAAGPRPALALAGGALAVAAGAGAWAFGQGRRRTLVWLFVLPPVLGLLVSGRAVHPGEETLLETESPYQYVRVYEKEGKRFLTLNEGRDQYHSLMIEGKVLTEGNYYDYLNLVPLHFDPAHRERLRVCVVGLAAGIYSRQIHAFFDPLYRVEIDGAEIDPGVLEAARLHFGLAGPLNRNLEAAPMDGRMLLATSRGGYDLIAVDAYSRQLYIPFHLVTKEFFALCRTRLAPGGMTAVNVCDFSGRSPALEAIRNTMAEVFGAVYVLRLPGTMNFLVYARKGKAPATAGQVLAGLEHPALASHPEAEALKERIRWSIHYRTRHEPEAGARVLTDDCAPLERLLDASFRDVRRRIEIE